jgi:hypothetical protein
MRIIRSLAASLLLLTGALHVINVVLTPGIPTALPMLIFGLVYLAIGVLLLLGAKHAELAGIVVPLIGLGAGILVSGIRNWSAFLFFLYGIDVAIVACCLVLLARKTAEASR